jgi:hypothetical protein
MRNYQNSRKRDNTIFNDELTYGYYHFRLIRLLN